VMFFFFKQKTAYEIRLSLVGSEMCIRDSMRHLPARINRNSELEMEMGVVSEKTSL